jgi:hypothetical protein
MKYKITNKGSPIDYENEIHSLTNFAKKRFGFRKPPSFVMKDDPGNASKLLGKTGYYDPNSMEIHIFTTGRHPKDILRSIAHELVHHMQNDKGELEQGGYSGQGYAQKNPHLRNMEKQAYEMGNLCFRDWEDGLKQEQPTIYNERRNRKMSFKDWKNKELGQNLTEKWGFKMDLSKLNESKKEYDLEENQDRIFAPSHYCAHHVIHEGKEGYTVDHNYNEKLGKVTRYDVKFGDGSIKRNIHESELTVLEAFTEESHGKRDEDHPPAKKDKGDNKKPDEDGDGVPDWADKKPGEDDHADSKKGKKGKKGGKAKKGKMPKGLADYHAKQKKGKK